MTKRKCHFADDFTRQCKFHVGESDVVDFEFHRKRVEEKTLKLLYGRERSKNNVDVNGSKGKKNNTDELESEKDVQVKDCCFTHTFIQKTSNCTYCEKNLCSGCVSICSQCRQDFCLACVFIKYVGAEDLHICLSCYS